MKYEPGQTNKYMKYEPGQIVQHVLTGDEFIVTNLELGRRYLCRGKNYAIHTFDEIELIPYAEKTTKKP